MKSAKVMLYSSLALLSGFIVRELLKAKAKVRTMAIRRSELQAFYDDESFRILYFNSFLDDHFLKKDAISLVAYKQTTATSKTMISVSLETTGEDKLFDIERDYSVYKLEKNDIKKILDLAKDKEVTYILFEPILYKEDNRFLAYKIIPADASKMPVGMSAATDYSELSLPPVEESAPPAGGARMAVMALTGSTGYLRMNPSPPATMNVSM
jgi:hypothetical protein